MDSIQLETYEAAIQMRQEKNTDAPVGIKDLLNLCYNLKCFEFRPGIINDRMLGEFCLEEDRLEWIHIFEVDVRKLLDPQRVGMDQRKEEMEMCIRDRARNTEIEACKKREKQLQYDYADLVYQLMVFTGAGLTVSRAWKQIVNHYEKRLEHENSQPRAVYEEMEIALGEMENGLPESLAVSRFGERCQHNEYRRLSSILGQSRQTGMKNLQELLAQEMDTAWEQQKQAAKRLGCLLYTSRCV